MAKNKTRTWPVRRLRKKHQCLWCDYEALLDYSNQEDWQNALNGGSEYMSLYHHCSVKHGMNDKWLYDNGVLSKGRCPVCGHVFPEDTTINSFHMLQHVVTRGKRSRDKHIMALIMMGYM